MNDKFDELTKGLAESVTRRGALKKFGLGLAGVVFASFGVANKAAAHPKACLPSGYRCKNDHQCCSGVCIGSHAFNLGCA
jgi:hypothetical protein